MPINLTSLLTLDLFNKITPGALTEAQRLINLPPRLQQQLLSASEARGLQFHYELGGITSYTPPGNNNNPATVNLSLNSLSDAKTLVGLISHEVAHVNDTSVSNSLASKKRKNVSKKRKNVRVKSCKATCGIRPSRTLLGSWRCTLGAPRPD